MKLHFRSCVEFAVLLSLAGAAHADPAAITSAAASPAAADENRDADAKQLEDIVVLSEGHPERLQSASAPITVFNAGRIEDAGIKNPEDFVRLVPNMAYDTSFTIGNSFVVMRGIQQLNNADAPIAIVVDGVPQNNQKEFKMDLFDIQQIEVLRGPQGALYGRNALGGAIEITTKQPTNATESFVDATLGSDGLYRVAGGISGPWLEDRLFYRVVASGATFDGSIDNSFTHKSVDGYRDHDIRVQTKWQLSEAQALDLRVNSSRLWGGAIYDTSFPAATPGDTNIFQAPLSDITGRSHRRLDSGTLRYQWLAGDVVLSAITGYTKLFENYYGDLDFCNPVACPGGLFGLGPADQQQVLNVRQLSQELRLSSRDDASTTWTAGVYGLRTQRDLETLAHLLAAGPAPLPIVHSNEGDHNTAWAAFGQAQVPLSDSDRLGVSLRYDRDSRTQTDRATGASRQASFDSWQPKVTYSHLFDARNQVYFSVAQGFRSGGFNGVDGAPFRAEKLSSAELGYKSSWLDDTLVFNNAVFYERDHDYQFFYVDVSAGGAQVIANLKRVDLRGAESELRWRARPGWELFASLGLLSSRIGEVGVIATPLPIRAGNRAPRTEPYNAVFGSQWNFELGAHSAMFRFDVSRRGPRTWEADNVDIMNPVTLVNSRFEYFGGTGWSAALWATNLFNHRYYSDFVPNTFSGLGRDVASPAQGRAYGVEFKLTR